jgi:hypothetical protein
MSRNKTRDLRNAMYKIEILIPRRDASKATERERDLVCVVNCAIWEGQMYKISAGLRRLAMIPDRGAEYARVMELLAV